MDHNTKPFFTVLCPADVCFFWGVGVDRLKVDGKCVEPDPEVVMEKILKPKVILNSEEAVEALAAAELDLKKAQDELEGASEAQEKVAESIEAAVEMKKDEL